MSGSYDPGKGQNSTVKLWNVTTGALLHTFDGYGGVRAVAVSPDGKMILSGHVDGIARVWDIASRSLLQTLPKQDGEILAVAFSPDGRKALSGSWQFKLWDLTTGAKLLEDRPFVGAVQGAAFSPDGQQILLAIGLARGRNVEIRKADTGALVHIFKGHDTAFDAALFSGDGSRLLLGGRDDNRIQLVEISTGELLRSWSVPAGVASLALSADGRRIAAGLFGGTLNIWQTSTGKLERSLTVTNWVKAVAFSPDGSQIPRGRW